MPVLAAVPTALAVLASAGGFHAAARPVSPGVRAQVRAAGNYHAGCPVGFSGLRILAVKHWGFDGRRHTGQLIVNARAVGPLTAAFRRLYALHFPIRHLSIDAMYVHPDGDASGSFSCRQAVPSPCTGGKGTGTWSMHAYGLAVDVNPRENPYVGCGQSRDPATRPYFDRSRHRRGMVTARTVRAFTASGWGWGGSWIGNTKDYMHFSSSGH